MSNCRRALVDVSKFVFLLFHALLSLLALDVNSSAFGSYKHVSSMQHSVASLLGDSGAAMLPRASIEEDMATITERRISTIIGSLESTSSIARWLRTLGADGKWPDSEVDLTTGCEARRANWPAQTHWRRILVMAGAWYGGAPNTDQWFHDAELHNATRLAMGYWFSRDMGQNIACLDSGGTPACPCENPENTLWNTNWFSNIILIPRLVSQTCLLLNSTLTPTEVAYCGDITTRTYGVFDRELNGIGELTAANTLDIAKISVDAGLLTNNAGIVADAYRRVHKEMGIVNGDKVDGIRPDGSFGQHAGIIYNGNYGKDYSNAVLELEIAGGGTQFQAADASKKALETLFEGNKWMIFRNTLTQGLHWDFSVIGRMLTFPVADNQASGSIKMNLTTVLELGNLWSSGVLKSFATDLSASSSTANPVQSLVGNKMFYTNDYMVHRTRNYITTLRMYSKRTTNTECINTQNPKGFHLADGALYHYQKGDEYTDIFASWDWDLIPGTTVDYRNTPLSCETTAQVGIESFVGGVSDGRSGVGAMRYTNPLNGALKWQKAWFLLDSGVYHVMVNVLSSTSSAPVFSVLDQKRRSGEVKVNGNPTPSLSPATATYTEPESIWHDNVGYTFPSNTSAHLNVRMGSITGRWLDIGTSTQPDTTVDLWAAWLEHTSIAEPIEYTMWPGVTYPDFKRKRGHSPVSTLEKSSKVSAIYHRKTNQVMAVFWDGNGGSFTFHGRGLAPLTISSKDAIALMVSLDDGTIVACDPSQTLAATSITFEFEGRGHLPKFWEGKSRSKTVLVSFPTDGLAGSSVSVKR